MQRGKELTYRGLDKAEIDYVIISPHDPEGMLRNCAECRELGLPLHLRPQPAAGPPERRAGRWPGWSARSRLTRQRLRAGGDQAEDRAGRSRHARRGWACWSSPGAATARRFMSRRPPGRCADRAGAAEIVDPTGVGDAFRGGLLIGLRAGLSVGGHRPHRRAGGHLLPGAGGDDEPPLHRARVRGALPGSVRGRAGTGRYA